jgi:hypothetical protein
MMHGRHEKLRPHHWGVVAASALAVVVAIGGFAWFARDTPSAEPTRQAQQTAVTIAPQTPTELERCREVWLAQGETLHTAGRSLAQWRIHIGAMNQLVAGEITLAQASRFWNTTRRGAAARIARFEVTEGAYADAAPRCTRTGEPDATDASALTGCLRSVRARDRAIDAGVEAVASWKHHVHDMELLRTGQLSPAAATERWLASWRTGARQLDRFGTVRRAAADAGRC